MGVGGLKGVSGYLLFLDLGTGYIGIAHSVKIHQGIHLFEHIFIYVIG